MNAKLLSLIFFGLLIRLALIPAAYHGDLNNNYSWGQEFLSRGANHYYEGENWPYSAPNQPPLYVYLFAVSYKSFEVISNTFNFLNINLSIFPSSLVWFWEKWGLVICLKIPSILADIGISVVIYKIVAKLRYENLALDISALWILNPIAWYSSAVWGQTDAIVNLIGLISLYLLINKKYQKAIILIAISILFKPSLLLFTPLIFLYIFQKNQDISFWIKTFSICLLIIFISAFPFHQNIDVFSWLVNLYKNRIIPGEIGYLTANAFNLWWLVDSGNTLDNTIYFGLPARLIGTIITLFSMLAILILQAKKSSHQKLIFSLMLTQLVVFLFMTRMHERYLYPFFPLAAIAASFNLQFVPIYLIASILYFLNIYHLFWAPDIPFLINLYEIPWFIPMIVIGYFSILLYTIQKAIKMP